MPEKFITTLRKETNYPSFRRVIKFYKLTGYVFAAMVFVSSILIKSDFTAIIGITGSIIITAIIKVTYEIASIIADIADSSAITASYHAQLLTKIMIAQPTPEQTFTSPDLENKINHE